MRRKRRGRRHYAAAGPLRLHDRLRADRPEPVKQPRSTDRLFRRRNGRFRPQFSRREWTASGNRSRPHARRQTDQPVRNQPRDTSTVVQRHPWNLAHGGPRLQRLYRMFESEVGAVPVNGAEGQSERSAAGVDAGGFALVGFLSVRA